MTGNDVTPVDGAALKRDNCVAVFRTLRADVRGRIVRLGSVVDNILQSHAYGDVPSIALGQGLSLAALLASALPDDGQIILQTQSDGRVPFMVADCRADGGLRGYAREASCGETGDSDAPDTQALPLTDALGLGRMAITLITGPGEGERYQGIMALDGDGLEKTAEAYFEEREGLATFVRLVVARTLEPGVAGAAARWHWRAGGLMVQHRTGAESDTSIGSDDPDADTDSWTRTRMLAETIEDHELLDPTLTSDRILLRLFHEDGVFVDRVFPIEAKCRCSKDKIAAVLDTFAAAEMADMVDDSGNIVVTCEFCAKTYVFAKPEAGAD